MKEKTTRLLRVRLAPTATTTVIVTALVAVAISDSALSQSAHVHGLATLRLAVESEALEIEFESPAANLLGFEHKAHSTEDRARVEKAATVLQAGDNLFVLNNADCKLDNVELDYSDLLSNQEPHHDEHHDKHADEHHAHEKHDHEKHHNHKESSHEDQEEHHDEHNHKGHAHEEHKESHSEISASYRFSCSSTDSLSSITVNLIDHFPAIEKINAMWVAEAGQGSENINATNKTIKLK